MDLSMTTYTVALSQMKQIIVLSVFCFFFEWCTMQTELNCKMNPAEISIAIAFKVRLHAKRTIANDLGAFWREWR